MIVVSTIWQVDIFNFWARCWERTHSSATSVAWWRVLFNYSGMTRTTVQLQAHDECNCTIQAQIRAPNDQSDSRILIELWLEALYVSLHRLWISLLIELGSKTIKQNTSNNKFSRYSCHHCLKMSTLSLEKNRLRSIDLNPLAINVTTAFTIANCLEHELLEGFSALALRQSKCCNSNFFNLFDKTKFLF